VILSLSLISFLPPAARFDTLVLDELDSNFGPSMTESYIKFLKKVTQLVPKVVAITPKLVDYGQDVTYYTVVKKGSRSVIKPGRLRA
jgi:ABC-type uncharacterized transport system ATPase subunit